MFKSFTKLGMAGGAVLEVFSDVVLVNQKFKLDKKTPKALFNK